MRDALLCLLAQLASQLGTGGVMLVLVVIGALTSLTVALARFLTKRLAPGSQTPGTAWLTAGLLAIGLYVFERLIDPLLRSRADMPAGFDPAAWERVTWMEWKLFKSPWAHPLLPLADHPALALLLHAVFWALMIVLLRWVLLRLPGRHPRERGVDIEYDTPEHTLPWYHRWAGATTARRADDRFRKWIRGAVLVLAPLHLAAGGLVATAAPDASGPRHLVQCAELSVEPLGPELPLPDGAMIPADLQDALGGAADDLEETTSRLTAFARHAPSAGAWVLGGLLLMLLSVHLLTSGRPHEGPQEEEEEETDEEAEAEPPPDPLAKLGVALREARPGARLEALERREGRDVEAAALPTWAGPVLTELARSLVGDPDPETPPSLYAHQRDVLDHLAESWTLRGEERAGPTPTLEEQALRSPVTRKDTTPHALVLAAEGSGRSTLAQLATLHVHMDRGATTLMLLPSRAAARDAAERLRETLLRSSARWNVHVCVAGDDLSAALLGGKTPAVVVGDVESIEAEILSDARSDAFIDRLGLVVVDDLDEMTGVAEMHLHMAMRRLWALIDTRRTDEAATRYPVVLLAIAGPCESAAAGVESWARHVLAAPLKVFEDDGAPRVPQVLLRRRDLVDAGGAEIPLHVLAEACDEGAIPWHMRLCGDGRRSVRRAEIDLGRLRRHHVEDPRDAEVVLLEGSFADVRREAQRLAHAGNHTGAGTAVLVLAPPADEEMVLHEEADDAPHAKRIAGLPKSIALSEPDLVRQRHFDRSLGREHDLEALRARFGKEFVDDALARMRDAGRITEREVFFFDRRTDDAATRTLVRTVREAAMGEPIQRDCVSDSSARWRVVDHGTSEELAVVDEALAEVWYPVGGVFLHPRGRYQVVGYGDRSVRADHVTERCRTTPDVAVTIAPEGEVDFTVRQLGGERTHVALTRAVVDERVLGMRRYGPGPVLLEHRRYEAPIASRYVTDVCLVRLALETRHGERVPAPGREALVPLAAAVRMMTRCALRGAHDLVGVDLVEMDVDGEGESVPHLVFFDRTLGGSGYAATIARDGLKDLLLLARLVLERLVGRELIRLRRLHDTSVDGDDVPWDLRGALELLDRALDPPVAERAESRKPKVEFTPGEGTRGDLGRLWISRTGRTDDLVWTRQRWDAAMGPVHFDVAVERRAILDAVRTATEAGAGEEPLRTRDAAEWGAAHRPALAAKPWELEILCGKLAEITGKDLVSAILGLVAAIPTRAHPLTPAERAPLVVLMRRRADIDAKTLTAFAILPDEIDAAVLVGEPGVYLQVEGEIYDLQGPTPVKPTDLDPTELQEALR